MKKNPFRYKSFYEMLKELIEKYNVRSGMSMSKFIYYILYN